MSDSALKSAQGGMVRTMSIINPTVQALKATWMADPQLSASLSLADKLAQIDTAKQAQIVALRLNSPMRSPDRTSALATFCEMLAQARRHA